MKTGALVWLLLGFFLLGDALDGCYEALAQTPPTSTISVARAATLTISARVPLRIEILKSVAMERGKPVQGRLTSPVYVGSQLALPADSLVHGVISGTPATGRPLRTNAMLDGDFTPLRTAVISFTSLTLPSGREVAIAARGVPRDAAMVRLGASVAHSSLKQRIRKAVDDQVDQVKGAIHDPHKGDRLKQLLYSQLPYHPQTVWAGSAFDADLTSALVIAPLDLHAPQAAETRDFTRGTVQARLITDLSSRTSTRGQEVIAVVSVPLLNAQNQLVLPEGSQMTGTVMQAKPARSFARNGTLRFTFRSITPAGSAEEKVDGSLRSIEGGKDQNLTMDSEGGTRAQPDKGRFLAPLTLAVMAAASQDDDSGLGRQAVTSNGFGLVARLISVAAPSRNVSTGFASYAFAKSIYRRFIARGRDVTFPRDTQLEVELSGR